MKAGSEPLQRTLQRKDGSRKSALKVAQFEPGTQIKYRAVYIWESGVNLESNQWVVDYLVENKKLFPKVSKGKSRKNKAWSKGYIETILFGIWFILSQCGTY